MNQCNKTKLLICKDQAPERRKNTLIVYLDVCAVNKPVA